MANFNLNKAILGGRLTADPELKQTPNGVFVCQFTVAVTRKANREKTDFINCVAWRSTGEFVSKHFGKGSMIAVCGSIQTRQYTDRDGNNRTAVEVNVEEVSFTGEKKERTEPQRAGDLQAYYPNRDFEDIADDEDDLPF